MHPSLAVVPAFPLFRALGSVAVIAAGWIALRQRRVGHRAVGSPVSVERPAPVAAGVDLARSKPSQATIDDTDLVDADLHRARLQGRSFAGRDLTGADLRSARLDRADLARADLGRADLSWASLRGADLHGASLSGTNLLEADLRDASLEGADLSRATGLEAAVFRGARSDRGTRWPPGLDPTSLGVVVDRFRAS